MFRRRVLLTEFCIDAVYPDWKQTLRRHVGSFLQDFINQLGRILRQLQCFSEMVISGEPTVAMIKLQEKHGAIHEAIDVPASFHRLRQHRRDQVSIDNLPILKKIKPGIHILGDIGDDDLIEKALILIPIIGIFSPQHRRPMHPLSDHIRAIVNYGVRIGAIAPIGAVEKFFPDREIRIKRNQLVEIRCRSFKHNFEHPFRYRLYAERIEGQITLVNRFGILDRIEDEGIFGGSCRIQNALPGKLEVMGSYGLTITPFRVFPNPEGSAIGADFPALSHTRYQFVVNIVGDQALHHVSQYDETRGIGGATRIQLRRLFPQGYGDAVPLNIYGPATETTCGVACRHRQ